MSAQVLQEYIANALRKPALGISESNIDAMLTLASKVRVQPITREIVVSAVILRRRYSLSQWDAATLAGAAVPGCGTVYSQDMSDGQVYNCVRGCGWRKVFDRSQKVHGRAIRPRRGQLQRPSNPGAFSLALPAATLRSDIASSRKATRLSSPSTAGRARDSGVKPSPARTRSWNSPKPVSACRLPGSTGMWGKRMKRVERGRADVIADTGGRRPSEHGARMAQLLLRRGQ